MLTKRTEYKGQGTSWWKSPPVCLSYLQLWHLKHLTQRHWRSKLYVFRPTGALIHLCPWHGGWIRADLSYWPSLCLSLSSAKYIAGQQLCIFRPDPFGVSELQVSWGTLSQGQLLWPTIYLQNMHFRDLAKDACKSFRLWRMENRFHLRLQFPSFIDLSSVSWKNVRRRRKDFMCILL